MKYRIITIERQFGSGGHEIGQKLAERLGISFYDNKLIDMAADYGEVNIQMLKNADEKRPGSLLYSLYEGANAKTGYHLPLQDAMYNLESGVIRTLAETEPCVIVGRCADFVLKSRPDTLKVFILADIDYRIARIMRSESATEKEAIGKIKKMDKNRGYYYNYYTDQRWSDPQYYDLTLNSSNLNLDLCVSMLASIYENTK